MVLVEQGLRSSRDGRIWRSGLAAAFREPTIPSKGLGICSGGVCACGVWKGAAAVAAADAEAAVAAIDAVREPPPTERTGRPETEELEEPASCGCRRASRRASSSCAKKSRPVLCAASRSSMALSAARVAVSRRCRTTAHTAPAAAPATAAPAMHSFAKGRSQAAKRRERLIIMATTSTTEKNYTLTLHYY